MLFKQDFWGGLADGSITLAFRRWTRPTVRTGGTLRAPVGVLAIDDVRVVTRNDISTKDATRAGYSSRAELLSELDKYRKGELYRIQFHFAGADPRVALRAADRLTAEELSALEGRLSRMDNASRNGPWTRATLKLIAENPRTRAGDLAAACHQERLAFKRNVRKLKELGLTESLEVGYRLSPRGRTLLRHLP